MFAEVQVETIPEQQWYNGFENIQKQKSKINTRDKIAMLTTLVTEMFPETINSSENKFIRFQERMEKILNY